MPGKEEKTAGQKLAERLTRKAPNAWERLRGEGHQVAMQFAEGYKEFLDAAKTEREAVTAVVAAAVEAGFRPLGELPPGGLAAGSKFYYVNRGKAVVLGVVGVEPLASGFKLVGAHLDVPRLDLKPNPLYESEGLALLKTHYYGGIKKYQWTSIPLALHGVVIKGDGERLELTIGEAEDDPVFTISDLLPHLAKDQMQKKLGEAIAGEELNLLAGSIPYDDEEVKEKVKLRVLEYLHQRYGLVEEDFTSAELEVVPAGRSRDIGFDRGLVGGYGQDDRVCSYTALRAILDLQQARHTALILLADKEEIGSTGNTGMQSRFLEYVVLELAGLAGPGGSVDPGRVLFNSRALSADVNAAMDPNHDGVMEKHNAARLGGGVVLTKYTGSGGKYHSNDANAEFVAEVRRLFNTTGIAWQVGELGKVDQGGGGTIAQYLANLGMDVVDCGPALLSMHAPFEVASKVDIYTTYQAYRAFLEA
ncbi:aminopeptidase 1 [Clostridiales bacterium PH28_bin88]|nr:aminopeptidase 1 [Clostridiales bacterium PH28_bin88]